MAVQVVPHVRARTVAGFWLDDVYRPLVETGEITPRMLARASADLRRLGEATAYAEAEARARGVPLGAAHIGRTTQAQVRLLRDYLEAEGVRGPVPGWDLNFAPDLRFLADVLAPDAPGEEGAHELTPPEELVDRLGAQRAIDMVELFYRLVLREPELATYFDGTKTGGVPVDMRAQREHFLHFVVQAFTGEPVYRGRSLRSAHEHLRIPEAHWRLVISLFVTALNLVEPKVAQRDVNALLVGIAPFHDEIVVDPEPPLSTAHREEPMTALTLIDRVGDEGIKALVDDFYVRVVGDDRVAHYFRGKDLEYIKFHQYRIFTVVAGGQWQGDEPRPNLAEWLRAAHRPLGITDPHFGIILLHLSDALDAAEVPKGDKLDVLDRVEALRGAIVSR